MHRPFAFATLLILLTSCATVEYQPVTEKADETKRGIHFYLGSPYLLVVKGVDAKGNPTISTQVVSLPDRSERFRAFNKRGLGKTSLELTVENGGAFKTTSATTDSVDTFAGILGALGTAAGVYDLALPRLAASSLLIQALLERRSRWTEPDCSERPPPAQTKAEIEPVGGTPPPFAG